ncbi:MAG TPA: hypothetical protein VMJ73_12160 [Rhizomicrobium sp.]|nr:hypothetical protein [Rhizomicrobium sp.]
MVTLDPFAQIVSDGNAFGLRLNSVCQHPNGGWTASWRTDVNGSRMTEEYWFESRCGATYEEAMAESLQHAVKRLMGLHDGQDLQANHE